MDATLDPARRFVEKFGTYDQLDPSVRRAEDAALLIRNHAQGASRAFEKGVLKANGQELLDRCWTRYGESAGRSDLSLASFPPRDTTQPREPITEAELKAYFVKLAQNMSKQEPSCRTISGDMGTIFRV